MPSLCQTTHTVSLTSSERVCLVLQNIASVSSLIHEVQLSDDTNRPCPGGVHLFGHLKSIRVGQVSVSGGDSKDEAVLSSDELQEHVLDLVLNVTGLVPHRDLGHARQVHQGEIQHWGGREGEGGRKGEGRGRKGGGRRRRQQWGGGKGRKQYAHMDCPLTAGLLHPTIQQVWLKLLLHHTMLALANVVHSSMHPSLTHLHTSPQ